MLLKQVINLTAAWGCCALLGMAVWGQQQEQSPWKDRAEYDLYNSMASEADPSKKLQLIDSYMQKYPESKFKLAVYLMYTLTYQQLKQPEKMYESAQKVLELDPKNIQGLYFITSLTTTMGKTDAPFLANGEKAAKALIEQISAAKKPEKMTDADWAKQRDGLLILGHQTLGWIAMNRKENAEAEQRFREVLKLQPRNAQVSYWLGTVIIAQRDPTKQAEAFYHFARAASLTGEGEMRPEGRQQVESYFRKIYTSFHGDESGLPEIMELAQKSPFPPAGFEVKSEAQIQAEKENELRAKDPKLYMWLNVKKQLSGPNGAAYFDSSVRNTAMPAMRGYLVAQSPEDRPDTLVLGVEDRSAREVTLKLAEAFRYPAPRGTVLNFECVPQRFSQDPFNVGFDCAPDKVSGWPPPPSRRPAR